MKIPLRSKIYRALLTIVLTFVLLSALSTRSLGQEHKSDSGKVHKNIVRFNLSNCLLFGWKNIIVGYERVVSPSQSFSINFGHAELPKLFSFNTDSASIKDQSNKTGFNVSADYRFYLKKENKHGAPRGVYIGPYLSFNDFTGNTTWDYNTDSGPEQVKMNSDFTVFGGGVQLGYQFIIKKRFAIDLILIGPGIASYSLNVKFEGNVNLEERKKLQEAFQNALEDKYPGINLAFNEKEINADGKLGTLSGGFRYLIHIGYSF
jgi:hypothetical protein